MIKPIRMCSCHNKPIQTDDCITGSFEYYCPINGEPCDTVIRESVSSNDKRRK